MVRHLLLSFLVSTTFPLYGDISLLNLEPVLCDKQLKMLEQHAHTWASSLRLTPNELQKAANILLLSHLVPFYDTTLICCTTNATTLMSLFIVDDDLSEEQKITTLKTVQKLIKKSRKALHKGITTQNQWEVCRALLESTKEEDKPLIKALNHVHNVIKREINTYLQGQTSTLEESLATIVRTLQKSPALSVQLAKLYQSLGIGELTQQFIQDNGSPDRVGQLDLAVKLNNALEAHHVATISTLLPITQEVINIEIIGSTLFALYYKVLYTTMKRQGLAPSYFTYIVNDTRMLALHERTKQLPHPDTLF